MGKMRTKDGWWLGTNPSVLWGSSNVVVFKNKRMGFDHFLMHRNKFNSTWRSSYSVDLTKLGYKRDLPFALVQ